MNEAFGMMDKAYFISKNELLKWLNTLLKVNLLFRYFTFINKKKRHFQKNKKK